MFGQRLSWEGRPRNGSSKVYPAISYHGYSCLTLKAMSEEVTDDGEQGIPVGTVGGRTAPRRKIEPYWRAQDLENLYIKLDDLFEEELRQETGQARFDHRHRPGPETMRFSEHPIDLRYKVFSNVQWSISVYPVQCC